jgi:hypothetical protein
MNKDQMTEALRKSIDQCGIDIVNSNKRLRAILSDFLPGANHKFERKFLLDALELDEWHILLETHDKGQTEHTRAVNVLLPLLRNYLGWTEERSILVLECYTTAMGWEDVADLQLQSQDQPNPQPKTSTSPIDLDDETRELLEYDKQLKKGSNDQKLQPKQSDVVPPPIVIQSEKSITAVTQSKRNITVAPTIGSIIKFGVYDWRVLDVQGDRALLISKEVTHEMRYNETQIDVTWETCTLRKWLNEDFIRTFSRQEQSQIALTTNLNKNNRCYGTLGGNQTQDRIFLLSISEVIQYFGGSSDLEMKTMNGWIDILISFVITDEFSSARIAEYNGSRFGWWLRSPGEKSDYAARVFNNGVLHIKGGLVHSPNKYFGVRPALWLKL